ncbi:MAG: hypothetical protein OES13_07040 [Acidimicrobiia bacterium]|nr:hypothetical protein [Acidimicrobiia bacterium]
MDIAREPALRRLRRAGVTEWRELGWIGRLALLGIVLSLGIAIALGFSIPNSAQGHLLDAQAENIAVIASEFVEDIPPETLSDTGVLDSFDQELRLRLLGGDTARVKVWAPDGTIIYSDASELIGQSFELTAPAAAALEGESSHKVSDLSDPAHEIDREIGELIEFYLPITSADGSVIGALEVEQRSDALRTTLGHIRRNVWISITFGLGLLTLFMASLVLAGARALNRRRRRAEELLGDVVAAQETERKRIVGSLHGDVGQPLYRLLYGLEGSREKVTEPEVVNELARLEDLVREIDRTLRAELRLLHRSEVEDVGLEPALQELAATTRTETDLDIDVDFQLNGGLTPTQSAALFWAAEEGLINARKHAAASKVTVRLWQESVRAVLEVADNGSGVARPEGIGLATTRERLDAIGGGLEVMPRRGGGTILRAWVLVEEAAS